MPRSRQAPRRGAALVLILVAMAVLGVMATGVLFAALREHRDGRDALRRARALAGAEYGLYRALAPAEWKQHWNTATERGLLATRTHDLGDGTVDTVRVWKLAPTTFLISSEAVVGIGPQRARRRIGLTVALRPPRIAPLAAVMARDRITLAGGSAISGDDASIPGWRCAPAADALPAVAVADRSLVTATDCGDGQCLTGAADIRTTPLAAAPETYERFGSLDRSALAARGVALAPGTMLYGPAPARDPKQGCDATEPRNLGDPLRVLGPASPCADHFVVAHAQGDLHITGGVGQGLLVVDGDLTLDAGVQFFGAVIVRGTLRLSGNARLTGAAMATLVTLDSRSRIDYSRCAISRVLQAAAVPMVPRGPAWVEMH